MVQPRRLLQTINWDAFLSWQPKAPSKFLKTSVASQIETLDAMIKDVHSSAAQMDHIMEQVRGTCQSIITTTKQEAREIMADTAQRTKTMEIEYENWEEEKKQIASTHNFEPTVKLDIGGHVFITTLTTLTRYPDTMLGAMFSGRHALKKNEAGAHFIDRDGTYFREILNFLRSPESFDNSGFHGRQLRELKSEAEYYGMKDLMFPPTPSNNQEGREPVWSDNALHELCEEMNAMYGISEETLSGDVGTSTEAPTSLLGDMGRLDVEKIGNPLYDLEGWKSKLQYVVPHGEVRILASRYCYCVVDIQNSSLITPSCYNCLVVTGSDRCQASCRRDHCPSQESKGRGACEQSQSSDASRGGEGREGRGGGSTAHMLTHLCTCSTCDST